MVKLSEKGQVTIPKKYRERFGLKPGDEVKFEVKGGELVVRKEATEFDDYEGYLGETDETVDEKMDRLRGSGEKTR
ncbi:MAG: AbrB/MazE/SpoVT family DNA-binding domain-containing protein [Halobacteria archaeon]|nr:AbrB/MazE/SpoVT family DNA-binding domain-containing protein [Halobacteria archaeon]